MSTRRTRLVVAGVAALGLVGLAVPAHAEDTTVTFTLAAGELSIAVPASANLGSVNSSTSATTIGGSLGQTVVTDTRSSLLAVHSVTLSSSNFTTGAKGPNETILGTTVTGMSGPVTHTNTTVGAVPVETTLAVASGATIMGLSAYNGSDKATYNPSVTIPVPATNAAGTYTGTITQTVIGV